MQIISRFFVRTSFVCLALALLSALLLALQPVFELSTALWLLTPIYFHLFMVGWVTQLIFGVAFWMFPKFTKEQPRGSTQLAWATYVGLNVGLLIRVVAEPMQAMSSAPLWKGLLVASAILQWLAALSFVFNTWPRIKER